jgi:hypothetical protein
VLVAILSHLGRSEEAAAAPRELLSLLSDPTPDSIRSMYERWNVGGELLERLMEGFARAGLDQDENQAGAISARLTPDS